jgi:hypothetical protein
VHPDLQNLEQFYIRTRADVSAGRLSGQEGIQRVLGNTITDASGRVWMVDHRSPDPNKASFRAGYPGQEPAPADPSSYQPLGSGMPSAPENDWNAVPTAVLPVEKPEKKTRFKRDKSSTAVSSGSPLAKLKNLALPWWVWIAGGVAFVLLLLAFGLLSTPAEAPNSSQKPTQTTVATQKPTTTLPTTTTPVVTVPLGELSEARVKEMVAALETLDPAVAQTVVVAQIDPVGFASFVEKHGRGERVVATAAPIEFSGTPTATVSMRRIDGSGTELAIGNVMLVKDESSGKWMFADLPNL